MHLNDRLDEYTSFWDWFLTIRNPFDPVNGHFYWEPTFLTNELEFYTIATLTFIHAYRHGARYIWLWFAILCHGLTVELVSYMMGAAIDNFHHAQATFMFFGQREPLQIVLVYPAYLYICAVATIRVGVPELCQGPTIALLVILLDLPYDCMGIKLLWWTWHDTDSNIRDRHYWVPFTSYYFHMSFACAFTLIYNHMRRRMTGLTGTFGTVELQKMPYAQQRKAENYRGEFIAMMTAGLFGMPFGVLQFVPGYHWGKDIFGIDAEFTTCMFAAIYLSIAVYGILHRRPENVRESGEREVKRGEKKFGKGRWYYDEVYLAMVIHFVHYMLLVLFANPETYQVYGLHQPMGSSPGSTDGLACDQTWNLTYPYPFTPSAWPQFLKSNYFDDVSIWQRPFLCPNEELLDEGIFGFHCEKGQTQEWVPGNQMFWICGTDYTNKGTGTSWWEYFFYIFGTSLLGMNVFTMFMYYPRTLFTQMFFYCEFPKYYRTDSPKKIITSIEDVRIGKKGLKEYKVRRMKNPSFYDKFISSTANPSHFDTAWMTEDELVTDGVGQVYGERHGQYGVLFDTYQGSTRDRIRVFESRKHSLERLELYNKNHDREELISYEHGIRRPASTKKKSSRKSRSKSPAPRSPTRGKKSASPSPSPSRRRQQQEGRSSSSSSPRRKAQLMSSDDDTD